jgi:hypothetical protein
VVEAVLPKCTGSVLAVASVTRPLHEFSEVEQQSNKSRRDPLPNQSARPRIYIRASLSFEQKTNEKKQKKYARRRALFHVFS